MIEFIWKKMLRLRARLYTAMLFRSFHSFGKNSVIVPPLRFNNLRHIQVGKNVTILGGCWLQAVDDDGGGIGEPKIIIHDGATIGMDATVTAAKLVVIEENVLFGRNVHVSDHSHEYHDIRVSVAAQGIRKKTEVRIGAGTWIGQNAAILPGTSIGKHCIIGANSVINTTIPDFSVAVGAPAKVIKQYNPASATWEPMPAHG
jgi:acetyltransferase-like isoleucine patch superfamily enzyme